MASSYNAFILASIELSVNPSAVDSYAEDNTQSQYCITILQSMYISVCRSLSRFARIYPKMYMELHPISFCRIGEMDQVLLTKWQMRLPAGSY